MVKLWSRLCREHVDTPKLPRESLKLPSLTSALNGDWTRWPSEIHSYLEFQCFSITYYFRFLFCRPLFPRRNHSQGQMLQEHDVLINICVHKCVLARANPPWKGSDFYCLRQTRAFLLSLQYFLNIGFLTVLFKLWSFVLYKKALLLISASLINWRVQCRMTTGATSLAENSYCFYCIILDNKLWKTWLKWEKKKRSLIFMKHNVL